MNEKFYKGIDFYELCHAFGLVDTYYSFNAWRRDVPKMLRDNMGITREKGAVILQLWTQTWDPNLTARERVSKLKNEEVKND